MRPPGRLLVLEGLDGSGKTTLARALADHLGAVPCTTPDPRLRAVRQVVDEALAADPLAGPLFYASTVLAASAQILPPSHCPMAGVKPRMRTL